MYPVKPHMQVDYKFDIPSCVYPMKTLYNLSNMTASPNHENDTEILLKQQNQIISKLNVLSDNIALTSNNKSDVVDMLLCKQNLVLSRLQNLFKTLTSINNDKEKDIDELMKKQELALSRLNDMKKVSKELCNERGIVVEETFDQLNLEQTHVLNRAKRLGEYVSSLTKLNKNKNEKKFSISVYANPLNPPVSLILFVKQLKENGFNVSCDSFIFKKTQLDGFSLRLDSYIKTQLQSEFKEYKLSKVNLIWRKNDFTDVICHNDIINDSPIYHEVGVLMLIAHLVNVEFKSFESTLTKLNDYFFSEDRNYKNGITVMMKILKTFDIKKPADQLLLAFMYSCMLECSSECRDSEKWKTISTKLEKQFGLGMLV